MLNMIGELNLMDDTVEMVRSNKGGAKIIHRGYMYTVHKRRIAGIRWRCARRILHCKGSITTTNNGPPVINLPHNHIPDLHAVAIARTRSVNDADLPPLTAETLINLHLGPTAKFTTGQPIPGFENIDYPSFQLDHIKEEYFEFGNDDKPVLSSPSPAPSTSSSLKSNVRPILPKPPPPKPAPVKSTKSTSSVTSAVEDAEVCLRWNSHHANMQTTFPILMDKEKYVDVTLAAGGQLIKCHKLILSSCSSYFDDMLKSTPAHQHPIIFIPKMEFWIVKALVEFMYKGEVNVDQTKLQSLIQAAEELHIKGLAKSSHKPTQSLNNSNAANNTNDSHNLDISLPQELYSQTLLTDSFQSENDEPIEDLLKPESPPPEQEDDDDYKPYSYYKKTKSKTKQPSTKKRKIPEPGDVKTVPCNLKGTKSRPNIKQPVFFDPDFPDHDPYRSVSPEIQPKEELYDTENIKTEPMDYDAPNSPQFNDNQDDDSTKLPMIIDVKSGIEAEFHEPPTKKPNLKSSESPTKALKDTLGDQITLEKITNEPTNKKNKTTKNTEVNGENEVGSSSEKISEPPPLLSVKKFASTESRITTPPPSLIKIKNDKSDENSLSKDCEVTFKKIKLPLKEEVIKNLTEKIDGSTNNEADDNDKQ